MSARFEIRIMSNGGASNYVVEADQISEKLRQIGLEWKNADWSHHQLVSITIRPLTNIDYLTNEEVDEILAAVEKLRPTSDEEFPAD